MPNKNELYSLIQRYEDAIANNRSIYFDADVFSDIADYYDKIGDLDSAKELINNALNIHPGNDLLQLKKAKLLVYEEQYTAALNILESISSGYDLDLYMVKTECLLQLERYEEANKYVTAILNNEKGNDDFNTTLADLGFLFSDVELYKNSAILLEKSLILNPENIDVLSDLAYAYEMLGNMEESINTINKILDIDSYNYDAWISLGKLYSLSDQYGKATEAFDFALTISDQDLNILKLKAHCLLLSDRPTEAILIFKDVLKRNPEDGSIYLLLSECYSSLGLFKEALLNLEFYKDIEGESFAYISKKASILLDMNKTIEALDLVQDAIEHDGRQIELLILSGDIKLSMENYASAQEDFKEAYILDSDNFDLIDKLAITAINLNEYQESIKYTKELLTVEPENKEIKQRLALLYLEIDDKENFNEILDSFSDEELMNLFKLFYQPQQPELFDRELLIASLNDAREYRTLFKNIKH